MNSEFPTSRIQLLSYLTLLTSILFSIAGQLLMKNTMSQTTASMFSWLFFQQLGIALSVYSIGVLNWIISLRFVKLSIAYPLTSLNYVGILLGSYYFFDEQVTLIRVVGVLLVFLGVLLVAFPIVKHKHV